MAVGQASVADDVRRMIEVEKKYRLTKKQRDAIRRRLKEIGAEDCGSEFEENILYGGGQLDPASKVLRLRKVGMEATLTYKERYRSKSDIKRQREEETTVADAKVVDRIIRLLGFRRVLVYEKLRHTWRVGPVELVLDELPFGLYMEIEGRGSEIRRLERQLAQPNLVVETATYPELTMLNGRRTRGVIESRFDHL